MNIVPLIFFFLACMAGICGGAFLLAAAVSFQQLGAPRESESFLIRWIHMLSGGWFSAGRGVAGNWSRERELRRLVYAAGVALLICVLCVVIAFKLAQ